MTACKVCRCDDCDMVCSGCHAECMANLRRVLSDRDELVDEVDRGRAHISYLRGIMSSASSIVRKHNDEELVEAYKILVGGLLNHPDEVANGP